MGGREGLHEADRDKLAMERPEIVDLSLAEMKTSFGVTTADIAKHLHFRPDTFEEVTGAYVESLPPIAGDDPTEATIHRLDHYRFKT